MQTEDNDAGRISKPKRQQVRKIEIEGQHNTAFASCLLHDFAVCQALQPRLPHVNRIVTAFAEPAHCCQRKSGVCEEIHPPASASGYVSSCASSATY